MIAWSCDANGESTLPQPSIRLKRYYFAIDTITRFFDCAPSRLHFSFCTRLTVPIAHSTLL